MGPMPVMPSGECPREFPGQEERNLLTQEEKDIFMLGCSKDYPQEVMRAWAKEWAKEGVTIGWEKLLPPKGFRALPRRWCSAHFLGLIRTGG
jgi:hypothetical protein